MSWAESATHQQDKVSTRSPLARAISRSYRLVGHPGLGWLQTVTPNKDTDTVTALTSMLCVRALGK